MHPVKPRPIKDKEDIRLLVEKFYEKVREDDLIGDIFNNALFFRWDTHIPVMIDFWETVLLGGTAYRGNTMRVHLELDERHPLRPEHFERWTLLFRETLNAYFTGEKAEEAMKRAELMSALIQAKLARRTNPGFVQ